jgi:hypothetical protein
MCFTSTSVNLEPYKAMFPIVVYKHLLSDNKALFNDLCYKRFKVNTEVKLKDRIHFPGTYTEGYHSYEFMNRYTNSVFIIPTGAKYLKGWQDGDAKGYISSNIIYCGRKYDPITWIYVAYKLIIN